jgi:hypothetical protein
MKLIKVIQELKDIANQGGISEKTSNHTVKGSKSLEAVITNLLEKHGFANWSESYTISDCHKEIQSYLIGRLHTDTTGIIKDDENKMPDNHFILQPSGSQAPVDLIVKCNGHLTYFELKTGGGPMPKYNDRFPSPRSIVIFVSSHKGKEMMTENIIQEDKGVYKAGPKKGQHKGFREKKERVPNPFLTDRCRLWFQGDIISKSNYSKFDQFIKLVKVESQRLFSELGFDPTVSSIDFRPIMNQGLKNCCKEYTANGITLSSEQREQRVIDYLQKL